MFRDKIFRYFVLGIIFLGYEFQLTEGESANLVCDSNNVGKYFPDPQGKNFEYIPQMTFNGAHYKLLAFLQLLSKFIKPNFRLSKISLL